jgi:hypothetical protein
MKVKEISYRSNELSADQKKNYTRCLVLSQDGKWYLFQNELHGGTRIMQPRDLFKSWDDFSTRVKDTERLELLHQQLFDGKPTAKELKDRVELSIKVWIKLCEVAESRLDEASPGQNTGAKRTAHKLADRKYEVVKFQIPADVKLPPQAKTCMAFFEEKAKKAGHDDAKGIFEISEKEFNEYVVEQAERLKTRQDPWRIFQYYRPQLIQGGFIRLV